MPNRIRFVLGLIFSITISLFFFQSCKKTKGCTDPYADNFSPTAEVDDNSCIPPRNKFLGVYKSKYNCTPDTQLVEIRADNVTLTDIVIDKLFGHGAAIKATINKAELVIPFKDYQGNSGRYIRGKGSIVGKTVTIEYQTGPYAVPDSVENNCVVTLTR